MKLLLPSAIIAVAFLAFGSSGFANKGDAGVVKERTQIMKSMAQAVRRIAPMAKGERAIDGVTLRSSAIVIANHGGDLVRLFPKGSGGAQSEAKSEIWSDMEGFNRRAVGMTAAAATLVALSSSIKQPALSELFKSLGGACSACHRQFRAKKI